MATANTRCSICEEETSTFICRGCSSDFCFDHLTEHRQILSTQLHQIQNDYNLFRQTLIDQKNDPHKRPLIQEINRWEKNSIDKIKQIAEKCRERLTNYTNTIINRIKITLDDPKQQPLPVSEKTQFNEIHLKQFKGKLQKLKEELDKPKGVFIEEQSSSPISKLRLIIPLNEDTKWKQNGITIAGGNGRGDSLDQLSRPNGISIDKDQTIYVADFYNNRIVEWKHNATEGRLVAGGNRKGHQLNQLNNPTDVIIDEETNSLIIADCGNRRVMRWSRQNKASGEVVIADIDCSRLTMTKDGSLYVSNCDKDEVRRWKRGEKGKGTIVAGRSELGGYDLSDHSIILNGLNSVFVDENESVYISDWKNHRVMKWMKDAKEGVVVAGGNGQSDSLKELSYPAGVLVDQLGHIYVAEWGNHRVTRWCQGAKEGTIVLGGHGAGQRSNQFYGPRGLAFDRQGNLYVAEWQNDRIQKFEIE